MNGRDQKCVYVIDGKDVRERSHQEDQDKGGWIILTGVFETEYGLV
jgi:hypothetical protein